MLASRNYYKPSWGFSAFRRLKNVMLVAEWVPDASALKAREEVEGAPLTAPQEQQLRDVFRLLDADGSGKLSPEETKQVWRLCGRGVGAAAEGCV